MTPVRTILAAGLVAGLSGCANLSPGLSFRPATERAKLDRGEVADAPPDLFHRTAETPTARLARYFPGLNRTEKLAPPTPRRATNPELRAVPREDCAGKRRRDRRPPALGSAPGDSRRGGDVARRGVGGPVGPDAHASSRGQRAGRD